VVGLWLALHDAHVGNGCLWARPGSHREPLRRRFVRTADGEDNGEVMMSFENVTGCAGGDAATARPTTTAS
jgi:ectoine hydroxylase-related dioxygenase (phytanoyl-CoA dioxygenase family)